MGQTPRKLANDKVSVFVLTSIELFDGALNTMELHFTRKHIVTDCHNCGELIILLNNHDLTELGKLIDKHLIENQECQKWHDQLPTLKSLRGIVK